MTLFEECLINLKNKATPLSMEESDKLEAILLCLFPFAYANIDLEKVEKKVLVDSNQPDIITNLEQLLQNPLDESIYVVWDAVEPVLKTDLFSAINCFDDITKVSVRTWLLNLHQGYVVEWHWCGLKVIALADKEKILQCNSLKECLDSWNIGVISSTELKKIYRIINRFFQPKYWNISGPFSLKSTSKIIPYIKEVLKKPVTQEIYLLWEDKSLPILQTNLNNVIALWDKIANIKSPFQVIDTEANYLVSFSLDHEIRVTFSLGLKQIE